MADYEAKVRDSSVFRNPQAAEPLREAEPEAGA